MYLLYCLCLFLWVYTLPALAIYPKLATSPRLLFVVPVFSVGVIYVAVTCLQALALYNASAVLLLSGAFTIVAAYRLASLKSKWDWPNMDKAVWLFILCLILPYSVKLGTEAFERGDEIYSWNFWGLQHYFNEALDFSHTSATYPQLFPKLISYCYMLLGDIQLQCPVKAMLGMFSIALLGAWASVLTPFTPKRLVFFLLGVLYVVGFLKLEQFFNDGYADPIMSAALVVSIAVLLQASFGQRLALAKEHLVGIAVFCGFVACATKQPAFLWLVLVMPIFLTIESFCLKQYRWLGFATLSVALAALWFMTEGSQFYNNQGVIYLSFEGRGYVEQFFHVFTRYLIKNPLLLLLLVATGLWAKTRQTRIIFYGLVIPHTFLWLMFGAYQLRLGQHVISVSTLLCFIYLSERELPTSLTWLKAWIVNKPRPLLSAMLGISLVACVGLYAKAYFKEKPYLDFKQGGRVSLERYFKADAQKVYDEIYLNDQALLWVPTRYIYGIFYRHTQLTTPDYHRYQPYTQAGVIEELRYKLPDYVFTVSEEVIDGPASRTLAQVIDQCPDSFELFATPPNKFNYTTYKIDKSQLLNDQCLTELASIG